MAGLSTTSSSSSSISSSEVAVATKVFTYSNSNFPSAQGMRDLMPAWVEGTDATFPAEAAADGEGYRNGDGDDGHNDYYPIFHDDVNNDENDDTYSGPYLYVCLFL